MHVIGWIIVGLLSGFIASRVVNRRGEGCLVNIALGLVGALVGGALFQALGHSPEGGFFYSTFVAIIGHHRASDLSRDHRAARIALAPQIEIQQYAPSTLS